MGSRRGTGSPHRAHSVRAAPFRSLFSIARGFSQLQFFIDRECRTRRTERLGASPDGDTQDGDVAYANVPKSEPTRYRAGWLPGDG